MRLTQEERRALAFIGGMILLSVLGRWVDRPQPVRGDLTAINLDSFETASRAMLPKRGVKAGAGRAGARPPTTSRSLRAPRAPRGASQEGPDGVASPAVSVPDSGVSGAKRSHKRSSGAARGAAAANMSGASGASSALSASRAWSASSAARAQTSQSAGAGTMQHPVFHITPVTPGGTGPLRSDGIRDGADEGGANHTAVVNLNTASAAELEKLPHVGPVMAERIVAYRQSVGRFTNVDALMGVKGVGPALLERLRPYLRTP